MLHPWGTALTKTPRVLVLWEIKVLRKIWTTNKLGIIHIEVSGMREKNKLSVIKR